MEISYKLVDSLYCFEDNNGGIFLGLPKEKNLYFDRSKKFVLDILQQFSSPITVREAVKALDERGIDISGSANEIIDMLVGNNILKEFFCSGEFLDILSQKQLVKYDRQIRQLASQPGSNYKQAVGFQKKLIDSHILVIGIGGVGSHIATGLASVGVGELTLVDFDEIELSNTSRQILYIEADVGQSKLKVAEAKLKQINPDIKINILNKEILKPSDLKSIAKENITSVALCADKPIDKIQYYVNQFCIDNGYPCIYGGPFGQGNISLGPFIIPSETRGYNDIFPQTERHVDDKRVQEINRNRVSAIIDTDNSIAAKFMEVELIKYITGYTNISTKDKQFMLDTQDWRMECNEV